jgi:sortase A
MRNVLGWVGRVLLTSGILLLLFVAYQLWGTGILESRQQDKLRDQFEQSQQSSAGTTKPTSTTGPDNPTVTTPTTTAAPLEVPPNGDAVAEISIPKIGVDKIVVEGVDVPDLRDGPGHYPVTPLPGQEGNAAIAGHRTTYGAPFGDLDQLAPGDEIKVTTLDKKTWTYRVNQDSPFVVKPSQGEVLQPLPDPNRPGHSLATLTLTTCNPKFSAAERLIVQATIVLPPGEVPLPAASIDPGTAKNTISGLEGDSGSRFPALLWGLIAALVGGAWWFLFHRYKNWYVWIAGAIPFIVVLFVFYTYLERLLPSNY